MDPDEELARQLQAEEDAAAAAAAAAPLGRRGGPADASASGQARIASILQTYAAKALHYEDELAQAMALSVMPMDRLASAAEEACVVSAAMGEAPPLAYEDALAQELLAWFKGEFFSWTNSPLCPACGATSTAATGMGTPSPEEAAHGAGRVEVYHCTACGTAVRFPRYNDPVKLLETRRGRCGEWANAFTLCCRAAGLDARLAIDLEDHVWTEQWSDAQRKWVHLDPCEAAHDKPLLYEAGWGKQLSYVFGVGRHGAADVTRRYTQQWERVQRKRTLVSEAWLEAALRQANTRLRAQLPAAERRRLEERDAADLHFMLSGGARLAPADLAALPARTTGDAAWLAARGEDGRAGAAALAAGASSVGAPAAVAAVPQPGSTGTRYRLVKDEGLAAMHPLRLCGGAVRASGENAPSEAARCAFDGSPHTKWLDFGGKAHNAAWLEYRLPAEQAPVVLGSYALTSANDEPARDPRHVVLEAWSDEDGSWVTLDEQTDLRFPGRHHRLEIAIGSGPNGGAGSSPSADVVASRRFRLRVVSVANPAAANSVQLAGLDLYRRPQQAQQAAAAVQHAEQQQVPSLDVAGTQLQPAAEAQGSDAANAVVAQSGEGQGAEPQGGPENPWAQLFTAAEQP